MNLISLDLEQPPIMATADPDPSPLPPGSISTGDIAAMEATFLTVRTASGQMVTPERAKRCATVIACMRGISEDLCSLPLPAYKRGDNGDDIVREHPVHRILNVAPNPVMTPIEIRENMVFNLMLHGSFFNLKYDDPTSPGTLGEVWPLNPALVTRLDVNPFGLMWTYSDPLTRTSGTFTPDTIWRGSLMSGNAIDGVGLTLLCREAVGMALAAEEQAGRLFSQGVQTDLALTTPDPLDPDQRADIRRGIAERHAGSRNAWSPWILEGGLTVQKLGLTAQESQYLESRNYQTQDIARAFRYPDVLLGGTSGKSSTYASAEQFFMAYVKHTLLPWAVRIEQTVLRDLFTTKEQAKYYVRHDFDQLLRADRNARFTAWNLAIAGGWFQPAEARRAEGLPYKPGLDYFNRSLNQAAIGGTPPGGTAPAPGTGQ